MNNWIGKRITLFPLPITVAGKKFTAIRARTVNGTLEATDEAIPASLAEDDEDEEGIPSERLVMPAKQNIDPFSLSFQVRNF